MCLRVEGIQNFISQFIPSILAYMIELIFIATTHTTISFHCFPFLLLDRFGAMLAAIPIPVKVGATSLLLSPLRRRPRRQNVLCIYQFSLYRSCTEALNQHHIRIQLCFFVLNVTGRRRSGSCSVYTDSSGTGKIELSNLSVLPRCSTVFLNS